MTPGAYPENLDPSVGIPLAICGTIVYLAMVVNDRRKLRKGKTQ